jgi:hypothetical protein
MQTIVISLLTFALPVAAAAQPAETVDMLNTDQLIEEGFISLFDGRDLTGWKVPEGDNGHWKVIDGVIDYDALSEAKGNKSLFTEADFGDFTLYFEWRFKATSGMYPMPTILPDGSYKTDADGKKIITPIPNADSGLLLRGGKHQANLWCWSVGSGELWSVRNNKNLTPEQRAAAVPKAKADRPVGQWNQMMITMKGDRITVVLNGLKVIDDAQIPGIDARGPIGLQHHGGRLGDGQRKRLKQQGVPVPDDPNAMGPASSLIQFRNIYIKPLN